MIHVIGLFWQRVSLGRNRTHTFRRSKVSFGRGLPFFLVLVTIPAAPPSPVPFSAGPGSSLHGPNRGSEKEWCIVGQIECMCLLCSLPAHPPLTFAPVPLYLYRQSLSAHHRPPSRPLLSLTARAARAVNDDSWEPVTG